MLKIMTLNINYYVDKHGTWSDRKGLILEAVQAKGPDILALQAVKKDPDVHNGQDQAGQLASELEGFSYVVFQPVMQHSDGSEDGSAFLSRLPILEHQALPLTTLPGLDDPNQRAVLNGLFQTSLGPLRVFNAHFSWVSKQTKKNLDEAIPYFDSFRETSVLLGDLNTSPESELVRTLQQSGWLDAWEILNHDQDGFSFEAGNASLRIDYIWIRPGLQQSLKKIELVSESENRSGTHLSDHLGLLATFAEE
jgi:endonuclease/exonuclease/phosphatase family metal-dependent hydrolase